MSGGHWFDEIYGDVNTVDEGEVLSVALEAVRLSLNINAEPKRYFVNIHKVLRIHRTVYFVKLHLI